VQIQISARHGHLDDATQAKIREKAEKLLHFFERVASIVITVDLSGDMMKAEILLNAEHKHDFVAHAEAEEVLPAVKAAVEKMKVQLTHYKEKLQDHRRDPSHSGEKT
jgi:putative sigma-54 modulation protein